MPSPCLSLISKSRVVILIKAPKSIAIMTSIEPLFFVQNTCLQPFHVDINAKGEHGPSLGTDFSMDDGRELTFRSPSNGIGAIEEVSKEGWTVSWDDKSWEGLLALVIAALLMPPSMGIVIGFEGRVGSPKPRNILGLELNYSSFKL